MRYLYIQYNTFGRRFNSTIPLNKALVIKAILILFLLGSAQSYAQIIIAADNANNYSAGNPWINTAMGVLGLAHGQLPPELEEAIFWEIPQMQE